MGFQDGAKLPPKAYFPNTDRSPGTVEKLFKLILLKKWRLGGLRVGFGRLQASIFEPPGSGCELIRRTVQRRMLSGVFLG